MSDESIEATVKKPPGRGLVSGLARILVLASALVAITQAAAFAQDQAAAREGKMAALLGSLPNPPLRLARTTDGFVDFLSAAPGDRLPLKAGGSGNAETDARRFLAEWSDLFHSPSSAVGYTTVKVKSSGGRNYVRLQQTYRSLPVYGAEVLIQVNPEGIVSVSSNILHDLKTLESGQTKTVPNVAAEAARQTAIASKLKTVAADLAASAPVLMIYSPPIIGNRGNPQLVWQTIVEGVNDPAIREFVLISAEKGTVTLSFTLVHTAKMRQIYDSNNTTADPGTPARFEGQPASPISDVNQAYDYFGDTYDFYFNNHGRDSIDDSGMVMSATTRYCYPSYPICPFDNAFWSGTRMYFGQGFAAADDVVGHELTHGVTDFESGLIYLNQSGAINESLSDVWGEFIDLSNVGGTDTAAVRWLMGEDVPGFGAIRDMQDPTSFGDPDRLCSPFFYSGGFDNGGVHTNSGVNNKLCYLLTDGDTFNGYTVTGMGIPRVADLYYEAQTNLLGPSSNYIALYGALTQAAVNLGFTNPERTNIDNACRAVEIVVPCPTPTAPLNDDCLNAFCISAEEPVQGTTLGAVESGDITSCTSDDTYDVWYIYTPLASETVTITTCHAATNYDTALAVFTECGGTELACNDDDFSCPSNGFASTLSLNMTAGEDYYIRVSGYGGETGNFTLTVSGGAGSCGGPPPAACNLHTFGGNNDSFSGINRMRGNVFRFTSPENISEIKTELTISGGTTLYFYILSSATLNGTYTVALQRIVNVNGTGQAFYSSGGVDFDPVPGTYYMIGCAWGNKSVYYHRLNPQALPRSWAFGTVEAGVILNNITLPLTGPVTYTPVFIEEYSMKICLRINSADEWELYE